MAAGYLDKDTGNLITTGNIVNYGTINVGNEGGIGMYAVGSGSSAKNYGDINLSANGTVGMYLDKNAVGENYGTIRTVAGSTAKVQVIKEYTMMEATIRVQEEQLRQQEVLRML